MNPEKKLSSKWTSELGDLSKYIWKRQKPRTDKEKLIALFNPTSVDDEMTEYLAFEIHQERDRELIANMYQIMRNE